MKATAKAHTNIALIKYWGKRNEELILPTNNSLSLTLDGFYTTTTVDFQEDFTEDRFELNGTLEQGEAYKRVTAFLDLVRQMAGKELYAHVASDNQVPTAAGFASSASGFAALAAAASKAIGLDLDPKELSRLTRRGSGSSSRSIYGGFAEWQMGEKEDGSDSYAVSIADENHWDIRMAGVVLTSEMKKISSRAGMRRTVETSPFYEGWLKSIPEDLSGIKEAIQEKDFIRVGEIAEANCLKMHATSLGAKPPFTYWLDSTIRVMHQVQEMREQGIPAYFTIDAGPNVKVLYLPEHESQVERILRKVPGVTDVILSKPGPGVSYL
ncbi:diphosphomevalonate decarboxylase [Oceanobacillus alkalisoli]|uniref:diphosphomevalonate decarboxylase n=1 Tax=Oceanobacillus alkalisoli TaxID=2925113 RepID=UPI001EF08619|nr:diphosphomevalonate decarboxylase [Oceanobacillus alkalisoli]MCF3943835.1 diphosphomevalonate decarboxylase [Oceanobacillus alkalisoli]MCG5103780.1 diphosphomevalonate decarboxylase [Oceanobacillus alkalisoli]